MSRLLSVPLSNQRSVEFTNAELFHPVYGKALWRWLSARGCYRRRVVSLISEFSLMNGVVVYSLGRFNLTVLHTVLLGYLLSFGLCLLVSRAHRGLWEAQEAVYREVRKIY